MKLVTVTPTTVAVVGSRESPGLLRIVARPPSSVGSIDRSFPCSWRAVNVVVAVVTVVRVW